MPPLEWDEFTNATIGEEEAPRFVASEELEAIARELIAKHQATLGDLLQARIAYALLEGRQPEQGSSREGTIDTIAKAQKAPDLWAHLGPWDGAIWANALVWRALPERARRAVVLHELLHFSWDEEHGKLKVLKHDIEEFGLVAREYGPWHGGLERFLEQLTLFGRKASKREGGQGA